MGAPERITIAEQDRSAFLGGSDAAAVMGLSPWATPVELWQQKTGRLPRVEPDAAARARYERGHKLEPFIRDMVIGKLCDEMGLQVELLACNLRYADPEHPFLSCEVDFELRLTGTVLIGNELVALAGEHVNADAKSVSGFARKKWGDADTEEVPIEYAAQFMHGLMLTGRRYCLVAALRSFDDVDIYWTVRDDETIAAMRPKLVSFWVDHVLADVPPDPMTFGDMKALFPMDNGLTVEANERIAAAVQRLRDVRSQLRALADVDEQLTFEIGEFIRPNSRLTRHGVEIATWKAQQQRRINQKALQEHQPEIARQVTETSTLRVLRLKKGPTE